MADAKLPALPTATPASGDLLYFVDVSDTTDDPTGSSKKTTVGDVLALVPPPAITTSTSTNFASGRGFLSDGDSVVPLTFGSGLTLTGSTLTANAGGVSDVVGGHGGWLPTGRRWATAFASATEDARLFDFVDGTFTRGSDAGGTWLKCGTAVSPQPQVRLKRPIGDCEIRIRYRTDGVLGVWPTPFARAISGGVGDGWAWGQNEAHVGFQPARFRISRNTTNFAGPDITASVGSTVDQFAVFRCEANLFRGKYWSGTYADEPTDWTVSYLATVNSPDLYAEGLAGVRWYNVNPDVRLYELSVTELARDSREHFWNTDFTAVDHNGNAAWWHGAGGPFPTRETVTGPNGLQVTALRTDDLVTAGQSVTLLIQNPYFGGNIYPFGQRTTRMEFTVWSKGQDITYPAEATEETAVAMYNFRDQSQSGGLAGWATRYGPLGPDANAGRGTWDWHQTRKVFTLTPTELKNTAFTTVNLHLHGCANEALNSQVSGTLWVYAPSLRPC